MSIRLHLEADFSDAGLLDPSQAPFACQAYVTLEDLAVGDSVAPQEFQFRLSVGTVLARSVPPGRYFLRVHTTRLDERPRFWPWPSSLIFAVGTITLLR